tara:strand:- start:324 stop:878 length:555 start_codon:yes stop_codon:yes gene_type:complete
MAIKIYVKEKGADEKEKRVFQASVQLAARKTLDGNLMIMDHPDINIILVPLESKILTLQKSGFGDQIYNVQDRFFKFLEARGVILPASIRSSNIYGSLEAEYPKDSKYADSFQVVLHTISKFIEEERPYMEAIKATDFMDDERLLNPDDPSSTELGDVPHEETKGTLVPSFPGYYYGLSGVYRY